MYKKAYAKGYLRAMHKMAFIFGAAPGQNQVSDQAIADENSATVAELSWEQRRKLSDANRAKYTAQQGVQDGTGGFGASWRAHGAEKEENKARREVANQLVGQDLLTGKERTAISAFNKDFQSVDFDKNQLAKADPKQLANTAYDFLSDQEVTRQISDPWRQEYQQDLMNRPADTSNITRRRHVAATRARARAIDNRARYARDAGMPVPQVPAAPDNHSRVAPGSYMPTPSVPASNNPASGLPASSTSGGQTWSFYTPMPDGSMMQRMPAPGEQQHLAELGKKLM